MTLVTYDFESATPSGTALSLGNTGANTLALNGGTAVSDNTVDVWSGSLCGKFVAAVNAQCLIRFLASSSNLTMSMGGGFEIDAQPANTVTLGTLRGSGLAMGLRWSTANTIMIADAAGGTTNLVTSATPGNRYWLSIAATTTATANTGTWVVNIYDSTGTVVGTSSLSSKNIGTVAFTGGDFGLVDTAHAAGVTVRWDNIQFNDGSSAGIAPPSTTITLTDTGAGTDALAVGATVSLAETGTAADAVAVTATVPLGDDPAIGTDALAVTATVPLADTATGADLISVTATVPLTDVGTAVDALTVTVLVPLSDTGTAVDSISGGGAPPVISLADVGTAADALALTATVPLADAGAAVDAMTVRAIVPLADVGTATDALTVTVRVSLADVGTAADALTGGAFVLQPTPPDRIDTPLATTRIYVVAVSPRVHVVPADSRTV